MSLSTIFSASILRSRALDTIHVCLWMVTAAALCILEKPLSLPIAVDNQIYFYIAERITAGVPPHVSQLDPKNALSAMITAIAIVFGRLFGVDDVLASRIISIAAVVVSVGLAWWLARRLFSNRGAAAVAAASPLCFFLFFHLGAMGARPKVFLVPAIFGALLAVDLRRWALAGALAGACFLVWQPALIVTASVIVASALTHERRRALPRVLVASLAVFGLYELYFAFYGALSEQLWQAFVFPAIYGKPSLNAFNVLRRIFEAGGKFPNAQLAMVPLAVGFVAVWVSCLLRPRACLRVCRQRPVVAAAVIYAHGALLFSVLDYQGRPDRLFLVPAAALAGGALATAAMFAIRAAGRRLGFDGLGVPQPATGALVSSLFALALAVNLEPSGARPAYRVSLSDQRELAAKIAAWQDEGLSIWAIGCPHLLALNHQTNISPFGYFPMRVRMYLNDLAEESGGMFAVADDRGQPPDLILYSRFALPVVNRWFRGRYVGVDEPEFGKARIQVYRRKALKAPRAIEAKRRTPRSPG